MSSTDVMASHQALLLELAQEAIEKRLAGETIAVHPGDYAEPLQVARATFVTLHIEDRLRGCIGALQAHRPLVEDVAGNAVSAAFKDPRFPALTRPEFECLDIHIAVLSPPESIRFSSYADLIVQLRPGVDGVIIEQGPARATFLPSVWEQLPDPHAFLRQLKLKAGLPAGYWSEHMRVQRYTTQSWGRGTNL